MTDLETYYRIWKNEDDGAPPPKDYPTWPASGIAILGDFSGIQTFVFRPIPGAGGAARRLRSRSFRVAAYTEIIARWCLRQLPVQATPLYSAGGRFLISVPSFSGWQNKIAEMQARIDAWAWGAFGGELIFHLGAAPYADGKIPGDELRSSLQSRRHQPLQHVLQSSGSWSDNVFFQAAATGDGKCDACGMTRHLIVTPDGEQICAGCSSDENIGKGLTRKRFALMSSHATHVTALGLGMDLHEDLKPHLNGDWLPLGSSTGPHSWPLLRYVPEGKNRFPVDFDELAKRSPGQRKWLGFMRLDVDRAGTQFDGLQGDPLRTWALSRLLNTFFAARANDLLENKYRNIYAVYGGGDDLFVIGPWTDLLDFALELRTELRSLTRDHISFSAGLSLAKPHEHILTQASLSGGELEQAKDEPGYHRKAGRDQIRALGATADWLTFESLLAAAKQVTGWLEGRQLSSSFVYQALQLHQDWDRARRAARPTTAMNLGFTAINRSCITRSNEM